jgi:hypothetical protein
MFPPKNFGLFLLGIYLILAGALGFLHFLAFLGFVLPILAIAAGVCLILGK